MRVFYVVDNYSPTAVKVSTIKIDNDSELLSLQVV